ncbi:hypothetical protein LEP1GSC145_2057 [Leptospira interrogans serovar Djasiman str. LT1649]|uniref:Uncharacterized protein n=1 Tax=Leptospira interrogans serovar Zanoni str. LT2156 TaxID=1001601 RepID=M6HRF0_LEPIR|nr:hypothetical protein LEP1GSC148_3749 [Leptospira interrogans serovar Canicola str. LT1962]EMM90018.1 hypothetical protein LEP1GSC145_2057 [Leptospira interrogans serovar Djasiman str. LT1649]EMM97549.1 hypothetical protein LEP1GSC158_3042 [Leptospira interrogans serovar Zanoni str. LT2156]
MNLFEKLKCKIYFKKRDNFELNAIFENVYIFTKSTANFWYHFHIFKW